MDKIKRFLLYIFGLFFIISSIQFYEKGQFGALLFMVLFGLSFFPVVYDNIKEKIPNLKLKYYVICSLSLFIICVILGAIGDEKVRVVKEEMENKTKMEVLLDESITTEDKIELIIKTSEIKELTINDKKEEIKDGEKKIILDLKDGENTIKIVGKNGEIIREFNQTIKKVTKEDLEKAKKEEKEKIEAEIKDFIIKSKDLIEQGSKGHFKTVEEQIQNNNSYIERYKDYSGISELNSLQKDLEKTKEKINEKLSSKWIYSENKDEMTDQLTFFAKIYSNNEVSQKFPYGDTKGYLTVRKKGNNLDVIFQIDNGQILHYNKSAKLRFDEEEAISVNINESSDYDSTTVFFSKENTIIEKLKKSKKLKVQIELYQEGNNIFEFDVNGFEL